MCVCIRMTSSTAQISASGSYCFLDESYKIGQAFFQFDNADELGFQLMLKRTNVKTPLYVLNHIGCLIKIARRGTKPAKISQLVFCFLPIIHLLIFWIEDSIYIFSFDNADGLGFQLMPTEDRCRNPIMCSEPWYVFTSLRTLSSSPLNYRCIITQL